MSATARGYRNVFSLNCRRGTPEGTSIFFLKKKKKKKQKKIHKKID